MKLKFFIAAAAATISMAVYQQCSVGGSEGDGVAGLSSNGESNPTNVPVMSFDQATITIPTSATTFTVTGGCNFGIYTNYTFSFNYLQTGATSAYSTRVSSTCSNGRFSLNLTAGSLSMNPNVTGVLRGKIIAIRSSGELEGLEARTNIAWSTTSSTTGTTTSNTTASTTAGTTAGTTSSTTGPTCTPDCSAAKRAQYNYCNSVPDGCGSFCSGTGSVGPNCPAAHTYCGALNDQCGNACATGTNCCPGPGRCKQQGGSCVWDACDSGADQCNCQCPGPGRWKQEGANCVWDPCDSGPNQCTPSS